MVRGGWRIAAVEEVKAKVKSVVAEKLGADIARAVTR